MAPRFARRRCRRCSNRRTAGPVFSPNGGVNKLVLLRYGGNPTCNRKAPSPGRPGSTTQSGRWPGLKLSATWFDTRFTGQIGTPVYENIYNVLGNPVYAPFVQTLERQQCRRSGQDRRAPGHARRARASIRRTPIPRSSMAATSIPAACISRGWMCRPVWPRDRPGTARPDRGGELPDRLQAQADPRRRLAVPGRHGRPAGRSAGQGFGDLDARRLVGDRRSQLCRRLRHRRRGQDRPLDHDRRAAGLARPGEGLAKGPVAGLVGAEPPGERSAVLRYAAGRRL
jgi:hypothetical protein